MLSKVAGSGDELLACPLAAEVVVDEFRLLAAELLLSFDASWKPWCASAPKRGERLERSSAMPTLDVGGVGGRVEGGCAAQGERDGQLLHLQAAGPPRSVPRPHATPTRKRHATREAPPISTPSQLGALGAARRRRCCMRNRGGRVRSGLIDLHICRLLPPSTRVPVIDRTVSPAPCWKANPPRILVDCGTGVGYEIDVPMSTFHNRPRPAVRVSPYTHFVARETATVGFATAEERATLPPLLKVRRGRAYGAGGAVRACR